jgi:hypothetical protein
MSQKAKHQFEFEVSLAYLLDEDIKNFIVLIASEVSSPEEAREIAQHAVVAITERFNLVDWTVEMQRAQDKGESGEVYNRFANFDVD